MPARHIFYDTETTGVKADRDRVIEIAAYDPVRNLTFEHLINPQCPIPPDASAIHHITDDMVANAPIFEEIAEKFIEFCDGDVILIAHNNDGFDIHFLRNEFQRCNKELPPWKFLDTLKWARRYRPDLPRHSLQFLREIYGFAANNAHRALDDVIILHQVFASMIDDLDIDTVYSLLNKPKEILHMPFGKYQGMPIQQLPKDYVNWLSGSGALDKPENTDLKQALDKVGLLSPVMSFI
ncbi:DNA polymerase III PolC-type [Candidatus Rubidus massiliensis]|nr:DNA polymerase III PolC-type [Candidatus Rubidus massiliensis]